MRALPLLLVALISTPALADWADFEESFPLLPCTDGWAGCVVDGKTVGGDMVRNDSIVAPADLRVDWFTLEPLPAFSPYQGLSDYAGPPTKKTSEEVAVVIPQEPPAVGDHKQVGARKVVKPPPIGGKKPVQLPEEPTPPTKTCGTVEEIRPAAMLGKLSKDQIGCLEAQIAGDSRITAKEMASQPLIANAWSARDTKEWTRLTKRHLDEIDRSDPTLSMAYARHLSRQGPSQTNATLFWTENAMQNRTIWSGSAYVKKTNALHKLRSRAAGKHWKYLAEQPGAQADPAQRAAIEKWRLDTRNYAREWYEYTVSAKLNSDQAKALCISASGAEDVCRVQ